jgi:hypothetical protein
MDPIRPMLGTAKRRRYTTAAGVVRAPLNVDAMDSSLRTFFRSLADYTVGTVIVVAQLAMADRRQRQVPALASGARR